MDSINPLYLKAQTLQAIRSSYKQQTPQTVALGQFLTPKALQQLKKEVQTGWKYEAVPDQYAYETRKTHPLQQAVRAYAQYIAGKEPIKHAPLRFGHRNFTLMHDEKPEPAGILAFLFLDDWNPEWGGELVLYRNGETLARFTPQANTLVIVERKKGVHNFFRYVNHHAKKQTFRVISA